MIITVSKKELFDEVEKRSSLEGSVLPERFEGVWASEEEGKFLDSYWVEGYTAVVQLMKRYLTGQTITYDLSTYDKDEVLTINATMPKRYNSLLDGSVATDVKMLIACNILHGWLEVKAPEAAAKYEEEAKGYTEDMRVKLLYRNEPTAKMVSAENDTNTIRNNEESLLAADSDVLRISDGSDFFGKDGADDSEIENEGLALGKDGSDDSEIENEGLALGKDGADDSEIENEGLALGKDGADDELLKDKEDKSLYGTLRMECDRNIYPEKEYIGEKYGCSEVPMKQGWNGFCDHGWYEEQQRIARESIMRGGCF